MNARVASILNKNDNKRYRKKINKELWKLWKLKAPSDLVFFSEGATEILDGPIIYVDPKSTLVLTCRVDFGDKTPEYIIWRKENKVSHRDCCSVTRCASTRHPEAEGFNYRHKPQHKLKTLNVILMLLCQKLDIYDINKGNALAPSSEHITMHN